MANVGVLGRVGIVGAGSVGIYVGSQLARSGERVSFLARSDYDIVMEKGYRLEGVRKEDNFSLYPVRVYLDPAKMGTQDLIIIATKATSNEELPDLIRPLMGKETRLLVLQNGLGGVEFFEDIFGPDVVFGGVCYMGLIRKIPAVVYNYNPKGGSIILGREKKSLFSLTESLKSALLRAHIDCRLNSSLAYAQWHKLVWNIPFNGLSIVSGGITTDLILKNPYLKKTCSRLMKEVQLMASMEGVIVSDAFIEEQLIFTEKMGAYSPSTLLDFKEGRPIELITLFGEPLRRAKVKQLDVPCMEMLYGQLSALI